MFTLDDYLTELELAEDLEATDEELEASRDIDDEELELLLSDIDNFVIDEDELTLL